jgi:hypothetical protein
VWVRFRPLHFPPSLANASQLDLQLTSGVTLVNVGEYWPWFTRSLVPMTGFDRGCVKSRVDWNCLTKQAKNPTCGSIVSNFFDQESPESKSGKLILCFYTASTHCGRW